MIDVSKFRELKAELEVKRAELGSFRSQHGERPESMNANYTSLSYYVAQPKTLHQFMCAGVRDGLERFYKAHKIRAAEGRKLAKQCIRTAVERIEKEAREKREITRNHRSKAKMLSAAVYRAFWGGAFRLLKVVHEKKAKLTQKKEQDKKVNEFLKLQSELADEILAEIQQSKAMGTDSGPSGIVIHLRKHRKSYKYVGAVKTSAASEKFSLFRGELRNYQRDGVEWLNTLSQKQVSCILADEMGLGKTVQTIAHFSHLAENMGIWGPHLIVVPTTVLGNWLEELHRFLPGFKVFAYFGRSADRKLKRKGWSEIDRFNVCVTTYRVISIDAKIFKRRRWFTMVLDEAHLIKNAKTHLFKTLNKIKTIHRILLTGTPLQNKLQELWTLMTFLFPASFGRRNSIIGNFEYYLEKAAKSNSSIYTAVIDKLHSILRPLILRRLKSEVEQELPRKTEEIVECALSRRQKLLYDQFIMRAGQETSRGFVQSLNVLMQLRKICNHPDLVDEKIAESSGIYGAIAYFVPGFIDFRAHERRTWFQERSTADKTVFMALLCIAHYHLSQRCYLKEYKDLQIRRTASRIMLNLSRAYPTTVSARHPVSPLVIAMPAVNERLRLFSTIDAMSEWTERSYGLFILHVTRVASRGVCTNLHAPSYCGAKVASPLPRIFSNSINSFVEDSGKMKALYHKLMQLRNQGRKVLIFTQMTKMLDYLEQLLSYKGFSYVRLDGSIATDKRQAIVQSFNENPKIMVFISSTRVGGIGINLTAADTVIFYDSDWNPAVDKQAQDRCHRIGQIRDVTVYRLVTAHTIEENILMTSSVKAKIDDIVMNRGNFTLKKLFDKLAKKGTGSNEDKLGKLLGVVEDEEDKLVDNADNQSEESKNDKEDEAGDFSDQIEQYQREIEMVYSILPPIYHYGLEVLKLTGCVKHIEEELQVERSDNEEATQDQEPELDEEGMTLRDTLAKRRMDVTGSDKDRFIQDYRKRIRVDAYHA